MITIIFEAHATSLDNEAGLSSGWNDVDLSELGLKQAVDLVETVKVQHVQTPFPGGESYEDTSRRMGLFLEDIKARHDGQTIMIVGHRATQYGLEEHLLGKTLESVVSATWKWQPGWIYKLEDEWSW